MNLKELFPDSLLSVEKFRIDVAGLWGRSKEQLECVRRNLPIDPSQIEDHSFVEQGSRNCGMSDDEFRRVAFSLKFIVTSASSDKASAKEIIDFLANELKPENDSGEKREFLVSLISSTKDERDADSEVGAFSFGLTYRSATVVPVIIPEKDGSTFSLRFGAQFDLSYYGPDSSVESVTINMGSIELEQLISRLKVGLDSIAEARANVEVVRHG